MPGAFVEVESADPHFLVIPFPILSIAARPIIQGEKIRVLRENPSNAVWLFYLKACVVLRYIPQKSCGFPRFPFC